MYLLFTVVIRLVAIETQKFRAYRYVIQHGCLEEKIILSFHPPVGSRWLLATSAVPR